MMYLPPPKQYGGSDDPIPAWAVILAVLGVILTLAVLLP